MYFLAWISLGFAWKIKSYLYSTYLEIPLISFLSKALIHLGISIDHFSCQNDKSLCKSTSFSDYLTKLMHLDIRIDHLRPDRLLIKCMYVKLFCLKQFSNRWKIPHSGARVLAEFPRKIPMPKLSRLHIISMIESSAYICRPVNELWGFLTVWK